MQPGRRTDLTHQVWEQGSNMRAVTYSSELSLLAAWILQKQPGCFAYHMHRR